MASTDTKNQTKSVPTGQVLRISEIRDDLVIMQNGMLRAVLAVSSTNFDLKNEDEQNGIIFGYQRFLNSLDFPIQILMQSRKLNIAEYISKLQMQTQRLDNELLRMQSTYYIDFISELVNDANIMSKNFYIVVPLAQNVTPEAPGLLARIFGGGATAQANKKMENIKKYKEQLQQRVDSIVSNLSGMGLRVVRLDTGALIELYYNSYNFEAAPTLNSESLGDIKVVDSTH
ncbi:MAG: hypothetical protein KBD66_03040 [Candidatus Doudnabacteria bacterium]|nr:hypothetical protein [Candidatus Doudnabacteria bacterium]